MVFYSFVCLLNGHSIIYGHGLFDWFIDLKSIQIETKSIYFQTKFSTSKETRF